MPNLPADPVAIALDGVRLTYDAGTPLAHEVLRGIDLALRERRIGIVGPNGCGKSTLVRLLDALLQPTAGRVTVDGLDTARDAAGVHRRTGFLFTDPDAQIIMPTVAEDVAFGLRRTRRDRSDAVRPRWRDRRRGGVAGQEEADAGRSGPRPHRPGAAALARAEREARARAQLERFGLADLADRPAHLLSGGQKQLLALAGVLITEPRLLVMDEPTTLLDRRHARLFGDIVATLPQTVVMATHHTELLTGFDRVLVMDAGRIVADGPPDQALAFHERLMDAR